MGRRKTAQNPLEAGNWLTRLLFRPRFLLLLAAGVTAIAAWPALRRALPELSRRDEYRLPATQIEITQPPRWVPPDFVKQVVKRSELPAEVSILNDGLAEQVARAFANHPWVAEVVRVKKDMPARVEVELVYRRPSAMVEMPSGLYPVDRDGVLLPPADFSASDAGRYPVIGDVSTTPQGPAGTPWGDAAVAGAAHVAAVLLPHWGQWGLEEIRFTRPAESSASVNEPIYELVTSGGSRIIWGRAPGTDYPGELATEQKLGRLKKYVTDFGGFDAPAGPYEIDIRHWQTISRRQITARPERSGRR